ncbi:LytTR family DNA-binding domain-containing protein [Apilactobacillus ozensis]|uniref:HTH LytTR-type domain-containing protein n=1 Tax=Apilactobacillus ozensis DSM 23829 = JCM 17196 TaxID=1423781 RepID=A0A0R2AS93_9LACO|nr:LytTR family DNA-binding domain-containing protein [Apilactobacillus ozensis]KRM69735.1 hypothetical protein FD06_GL000908 [Apilactobacillus ozensis DSM 23829 = JCM 17196]MCK8607086.1 LytTR family transcriptional regulator [Apilactobacillus ozensis]
MKINFSQDNNLDEHEILVDVHASQLSSEVVDLIHKLESFEENSSKHVSIYYRDQFIMLNQSDVISVEVLKNKLTINTTKNTYETNGSLKNMVDKLNHDFIQISKFAVVNINHLKSMETAFSGNMTAFLTNGLKVHVSRKYLPNLKQRLGI